MEGPSISLAAVWLQPLIGNVITTTSGSTKKIDKERLVGLKLCNIISFGKQLFFQFDDFALRVHFMLYGNFEASIEGRLVTGDYPKKNRIPRLSLTFPNGNLEMYNCSLRFVEDKNVAENCDFSIDIMASAWDGKKAIAQLLENREEQIADVLLDQTIFAGVGNIIKNEVLIRAKIHPEQKIAELSTTKLKQIVSITRGYVFDFYEWRKHFELKKHYLIYRQSICKNCGGKVNRRKTGRRERISYICQHCQTLITGKNRQGKQR